MTTGEPDAGTWISPIMRRFSAPEKTAQTMRSRYLRCIRALIAKKTERILLLEANMKIFKAKCFPNHKNMYYVGTHEKTSTY